MKTLTLDMDPAALAKLDCEWALVKRMNENTGKYRFVFSWMCGEKLGLLVSPTAIGLAKKIKKMLEKK